MGLLADTRETTLFQLIDLSPWGPHWRLQEAAVLTGGCWSLPLNLGVKSFRGPGEDSSWRQGRVAVGKGWLAPESGPQPPKPLNEVSY